MGLNYSSYKGHIEIYLGFSKDEDVCVLSFDVSFKALRRDATSTMDTLSTYQIKKETTFFVEDANEHIFQAAILKHPSVFAGNSIFEGNTVFVGCSISKFLLPPVLVLFNAR